LRAAELESLVDFWEEVKNDLGKYKKVHGGGGGVGGLWVTVLTLIAFLIIYLSIFLSHFQYFLSLIL
jgi:hypothetical protein